MKKNIKEILNNQIEILIQLSNEETRLDFIEIKNLHNFMLENVSIYRKKFLDESSEKNQNFENNIYDIKTITDKSYDSKESKSEKPFIENVDGKIVTDGAEIGGNEVNRFSNNKDNSIGEQSKVIEEDKSKNGFEGVSKIKENTKRKNGEKIFFISSNYKNFFI